MQDLVSKIKINKEQIKNSGMYTVDGEGKVVLANKV